MKLVVAVIHPVRLRAAKEALEQVEVQRITICDSQEWVRATDFSGVRSTLHQATVRRMITLEIAVNDDFLGRTISALEKVCQVHRGGIVNGGVIYVLPMDEACSFFPVTRGPGAI